MASWRACEGISSFCRPPQTEKVAELRAKQSLSCFSQAATKASSFCKVSSALKYLSFQARKGRNCLRAQMLELRHFSQAGVFRHPA